MIRAIAAAAVLAATVTLVPSAAADPVVPQLRDDAVLGQPCENTVRYVFGTDATGAVFSCGSSGKPGEWVQISNLIGVRDIGTTCFSDVISVNPTGNGWTAAQSPDGEPLFCSYPTDTWEVHPTT